MTDAIQPERHLEPDDLIDAARRASERARASGALVPLNTDLRRLDDGAVPFGVRVSPNVAHKQAAAEADDDTDPFAPPYDHDLFVGHISATHAVLVNKFNVLEDHLLLVTRAWAHQTERLTTTDYDALLRALAGVDGLAFYNGGAEAGASQPHKHLQIVPLPLAPAVPGLPFAALLESTVLDQGVGHMPGLGCAHAVLRMDPAWLHDPGGHAPVLLEAVERLWRALGYDPTGGQQPAPYNLLATRRWLWLVPRRHAGWSGLAVNALGYAGGLLARDEAAFERLREARPMALLADCAHPRTGG